MFRGSDPGAWVGSLAEQALDDVTQPISYWLDTTEGEDPPSSPLPAEPVDVAVVGAGILGLTTAVYLAGEGLSVAVLERDRVAAATTGHTTAKVTALHGTIYHRILGDHGVDVAIAYAAANRWGVEEVRRLSAACDIDCGWDVLPAYTYATDDEGAAIIEKEAAAAIRAGLPVATEAPDIGLPFPVAASVRLDRQGLFHPRRYGLGLTEVLRSEGVPVVTGCDVRNVTSDGQLETSHGPLLARSVVLATHLPFLNRGGQFAITQPSRSYAIAARIQQEAPPGMYLAAGSPTRSVRPVSLTGDEVVVGGEGHIAGRDTDTRRRYEALAAWAREAYPRATITHRWSAHDYVPATGLPSIGRLPSPGRPIYTATGFAKWGITTSTAAARILTDVVLGRDHPWPALAGASLRRLGVATPPAFRFNAEVAQRFVGDRLRSRGAVDLDSLAPGGAMVGMLAGRRVAAHRGDDGSLHVVAARCTHLGCIVQWNTAERTWDCPCHGSRFSPEGAVVHGPALDPLETVRPTAESELRGDD